MISRNIEFDEETDRILTALATDYDGDRGKALADLIRTSETQEAFATECEEFHHDLLLTQRTRSEESFRQGRGTDWQIVKQRLGL